MSRRPGARCLNCGARVPRVRLRAHLDEPSCVVEETRAYFHARGWGLLPSWQEADACAALGLPEPREGEHLARGATREGGALRNDPPVVRGWWAPRPLLRALALVSALHLRPPALRLEAAARAWRDPEWADALRAARALGGVEAARRLVRTASAPERPSPGA